MTTATKQPTSIIALLNEPLGAGSFRCKAAAPPWAVDESPPAPAAESRLLTVAQAAAVVPLSTKQLYRVAKREDGPFRKVEGRWMVYEGELHRWIKSHPIGSKSAASEATGSLADRVRQRRREGGES